MRNVVVFYRLVDFLSLYFEKLAGKTESTLDDQLVPLVRKILKAFVIVTGVLFVLLNLNISIIPFLIKNLMSLPAQPFNVKRGSAPL